MAKRSKKNPKIVAPINILFSKVFFEKIGLLDENLRFKMDRDFFIRVGKVGDVKRIPQYLASFRTHPGAKSTPGNVRKAWQEFFLIRERHGAPYSLKVHLHYYLELILRRLIVDPISAFPKGKALFGFMRRRNMVPWF